jgi:hypothetical protein
MAGESLLAQTCLALSPDRNGVILNQLRPHLRGIRHKGGCGRAPATGALPHEKISSRRHNPRVDDRHRNR